MQHLFKEVRDLVEKNDFQSLHGLTIPYPEKFNWVRDVFEGIHVKETPLKQALLWTNGKDIHPYSFVELSEITNQLLNFLRNKGIKKDDLLFTILGLQEINWLSILACIKGGFRMVPAATILSVHDIVYRFGKLMPKIVISDFENSVKIDEAEKLSGNEVAIKILADGKKEGWYTWDEFQREDKWAEAADTSPQDPLFLFFTSGTTGMPKVVTHTHLSYPFGHLSTLAWIGIKKNDIHYNISQPGWGKFAWSSFFAPWNVGATIFAYHHSGRFNAKDTLEMMERFKINTFCAPPTVFRLLIVENLLKYKFNLRECVSAGEPLNPEIIETWKKGTGLIIRDGFGQTESTCLVANLPGDKVKYGSMGKPTFLYDIIIADEFGRELPSEMEGNICVKTKNSKPNGLFLEYFGDPGKGKEVFRHDLYYTGDKAYRDKDGFIWFVGRDDDIIKSSDYRIGPFEVESVLQEHEGVLESAVVGSPHPVKGAEIKAFIVLNREYLGTQMLAEDLFAFAKKNLAPYKFPRIIEFVTELPKTISGKIKRIEIRAQEAESKAKGQKRQNEYLYVK